MKSSQTNTWKLGLFVTVALSALGAAIWWLGLNRLDKETTPLVTYFDESVQGLDVGAPVKMRGVRIGNVSAIGFGPDGLTVQVTADLYVSTLEKLGLGGDLLRQDPSTGRSDYGDLRARVAMQGITGVCFLAVDNMPGMEVQDLPFPAPPNYLPAAPSTLARLEEGAFGIVDKLPGIIENLDLVFTSLAQDLDVGTVSRSVTELFTSIDAQVDALDLAALQTELRGLIAELRALIARGDGVLAQLEGEPAPIERIVGAIETLARSVDQELQRSDFGATTAELRSTSQAFGQLARDMNQLTGEAALDLVALRDALGALRSFLELLERNPSALVRGRQDD